MYAHTHTQLFPSNNKVTRLEFLRIIKQVRAAESITVSSLYGSREARLVKLPGISKRQKDQFKEI